MTREFKSLRTSNTGPRTFKKWEEWDKGDTLVLKFLSTIENKFDKSSTKEKPNYLFKILDVVELKDKKYKFKDENLVLNTTGKLKFLMESLMVQPGEVILLKYQGTETLEKGDFAGSKVHSLEMEVIDYEETEEGI